jgi:hypothetical protein
MSSDFMNSGTAGNLTELWRGERMCLIGIDVDQSERDFVGFSIEVKSPGHANFAPLRNRGKYIHRVTKQHVPSD